MCYKVYSYKHNLGQDSQISPLHPTLQLHYHMKLFPLQLIRGLYISCKTTDPVSTVTENTPVTIGIETTTQLCTKVHNLLLLAGVSMKEPRSVQIEHQAHIQAATFGYK